MRGRAAPREHSTAIVLAIETQLVQPRNGWFNPKEIAAVCGITLAQAQNSIRYMCSEYDAFDRPRGWGIKPKPDGITNFWCVERTYSVPFANERAKIARGEL
jgi:hypothetical protein